ncbi:MAG: (d)CMP kinase [Microbacteriaceae bacterium]|nr:(d)CMP kinase [Microbacteriaceae bacterium]
MIVVAIDGPAGSGKSSVARAVAAQLGYGFLDTGASYRALTWWALDQDIDLADEDAVAGLLGTFTYSSSLDPDLESFAVGDVDVTAKIRDPRISLAVSAVAQNLRVREWMKNSARDLATHSGFPGVVAEGRDMTTVVFPDASTRILLTAREEVRIERRAGDVAGRDLAETTASVRERDAKDSNVVDFFTAAPGVTVVDSSDINFSDTVSAIVDIVRAGSDQ